MNTPPDSTASRVPFERLRAFAVEYALNLGIAEKKAHRLGCILATNDLRGVHTHGVRMLLRYTREIREGALNPRADVRLVHETPTSVTMDGDGGLGYFPAYEGTLKAIEKAEQYGMAAMVSRNHGHIGAAGVYARLTLEHDLLTFVTSGVQLDLKPGDLAYKAAGVSPMSFSAPAGEEPPLVLDCGVTHDLQGPNPPHRDEVARLTPGLVLRAIGFGTICQAWGGLLTGLPIRSGEADRTYPAANQGAMLFAFKISLFADPDAFKEQMDEYARQVRRLQPIEVMERAYLPGGPEYECEQFYRREGVPIDANTTRRLGECAAEVGLRPPW